MLATLVGRPDHRLDEPAHPAGRRTLMDIVTVEPAPPIRAGRPAPQPRSGRRRAARRSRLLLRRPGVHHRQHRHHRLGHHGHPRRADHAVRPVQRLLAGPPAAEPGAPVRHRPARPRRPVAGHGRVARRAHRRAARGAARGRRRDAPRPDHGLLPRHGRRRPQPDRRGVPGPAGHPRRAADARRARVVAARRRVRRRDPVHADRRPDRALGRPVRAPAGLRRRRPSCAASPGRSSCRARSSRTSSARPSSS